MRWTPTGLVIVGTWARDPSDDAMTATATLGEFSCTEDPDPLHCHAISHPAGLWMGIYVPGMGQTTARDVTPVTQCHLIAHIDTTLGRWFGAGVDPNGDFLAFNGTATLEAAHSPDDRATQISLRASVHKDDETVDFTAFGSVDGGDMQDIYGAAPIPWRGHRVLGTDALLRSEPHPAQPANDAYQHPSRPPAHDRAPAASGNRGLLSPAVGVDTRIDPLTDLESLASSDDDDDGNMSAENGEADSSHRTDTCARPHATQPRTATTAAPHNSHPSPRGPCDLRHPWRRMVPNLHRPRRPVLLGRRRHLHPSHLSDSTRAHTARRTHMVTTPAAAAALVPTPRSRRSCVSRRATLPLLPGHSIRTPALTRPRLAPPWHASGNTPRPPQ